MWYVFKQLLRNNVNKQTGACCIYLYFLWILFLPKCFISNINVWQRRIGYSENSKDTPIRYLRNAWLSWNNNAFLLYLNPRTRPLMDVDCKSEVHTDSTQARHDVFTVYKRKSLLKRSSQTRLLATSVSSSWFMTKNKLNVHRLDAIDKFEFAKEVLYVTRNVSKVWRRRFRKHSVAVIAWFNRYWSDLWAIGSHWSTGRITLNNCALSYISSR